MGWHVYILRCRDGTLYTGTTTNLVRRLVEHNTGPRGATYTAGRRPVRLVFSVPCPNRSAAQRLEARIKRLRRAEKDRLIQSARSPR